MVEGKSIHIVRARNRLSAGAIIKVDIFASEGIDCSFRKSFKASAIGCGRPAMETLFGPFRV